MRDFFQINIINIYTHIKQGGRSGELRGRRVKGMGIEMKP